MQIMKEFKITDTLSAAADAFARNLATSDSDHVRDVMSSKAAIAAEASWWHDNESQQSGADGDDEFRYADLDGDEVARTVVSLFSGWKWRDATEYGTSEMVLPPVLHPEEAVLVAQTPRAQRPRKLRKGKLDIATILEY